MLTKGALVGVEEGNGEAVGAGRAVSASEGLLEGCKDMVGDSVVGSGGATLEQTEKVVPSKHTW